MMSNIAMSNIAILTNDKGVVNTAGNYLVINFTLIKEALSLRPKFYNIKSYVSQTWES